MAKSPNQKLKLLYLLQILLEETDEQHAISMNEILDRLKTLGISAERKSIYSDLESLRSFGLDVIGEQQEQTYGYYVGSRSFELAELKLLVDSVQAARFMTEKKSRELIRKIEGLASKYDAKKLQRQVLVTERVKTGNESIYYNVDAIHEAIAENQKIRFQYFQWNVRKEMELRHGGAYYQVSPWALCWDHENYYLIAFDDEEAMIKHFRVDKMLHIAGVEEKRQGKEAFKELDLAAYERTMFSMYHGRETTVKLHCDNDMAGAMIDRFGRDVSIQTEDAAHFSAFVKVAVSRQFLHWVMALGDGVQIVGPPEVVEEARQEVERLSRQYL